MKNSSDTTTLATHAFCLEVNVASGVGVAESPFWHRHVSGDTETGLEVKFQTKTTMRLTNGMKVGLNQFSVSCPANGFVFILSKLSRKKTFSESWSTTCPLSPYCATASISTLTTTTTTQTIADIPNSTKGATTDSSTPLIVDTRSFINEYCLNIDINASISSFDHFIYQRPNYLISGALCSSSISKDVQNQQRRQDARDGTTSAGRLHQRPVRSCNEETKSAVPALRAPTRMERQVVHQSALLLLQRLRTLSRGDGRGGKGRECAWCGGDVVGTWSWCYPSSTTTTTTDVRAVERGGAEKVEVGEGFKEAGTINANSATDIEDAEAAPSTEIQTPASTTTIELEVNPIAQTFEPNKSGWASFFCSKTLVVKTLGHKTPLLVEDRPEGGGLKAYSGSAGVMELAKTTTRGATTSLHLRRRGTAQTPR
ncbi:hypothetical protein NLJ89_g1042 [Agrocybe chaxingu]|uniref:Uncharacterized protein n=1 Tax=Agrocybe chaxingu TaxID=84603 RepID=A0A9W8TFU3_9AGAR|nr:hypothetical protein NLJ89_g1042 [Agrocybe chaxingu]